MHFIDLQTQYTRYQQEIGAAIQEVMDTARFINGPQVSKLEEELAAYTGAAHGVGFSSGTDSLLALLMAWGIGPGDEVITTPFTFIATAEVIALVGATPVFVDIVDDTLNIDPARIEAAITPNTKAIMPVSLYGQCADFDPINEIAHKHGLPCLEDACQSLGAAYKSKRSCSLTTAAAVSFFPAKPLGCYGDGGMAFTDDAALCEELKVVRGHGQTARYQHARLGINGRLDSMQAAILLVKLAHFQDEIDARQKVAKGYMERLAPLADRIRPPTIREENLSAYAQFTVRVKNRDAVQKAMSEMKIPTAVHYPIPLHMQPVFKPLGYVEGAFPVAEQAAREVLSLPMHPFMSVEDQDRVVAALEAAVDRSG